MAEILEFYTYEPIDLCACYEPIFIPPQELLEQWQKMTEKRNPFRCTVERKIGNTFYLIETKCAGEERLSDKVKRLIFSDMEVGCS